MITLAVIAKHNALGYQALVELASYHVNDIVTVVDDGADEGIDGWLEDRVRYFRRPLAHDFGAQRNFAQLHAQNEWILHLDTDENLSPWLWQRLPTLLPDDYEDVVVLPRANYISGLSKSLTDFIGWPDWQPKLVRKHVTWRNRVHEWPNSDLLAYLPCDVKFAILHNKTADMQNRSNLFYETFKT